MAAATRAPALTTGDGHSSANGAPLRASRLLTAHDVAARWQVPKAHVYRLSREGRVPFVRLGRYFRYRLDDLEAFERHGGAGVADA